MLLLSKIVTLDNYEVDGICRNYDSKSSDNDENGHVNFSENSNWTTKGSYDKG